MDNIEAIKNSLRASQKVFSGLADYRIIGSVLVAAINGKPHRELHDVDLLIDERIYKEVSARFRTLGFKRVTRHAPGFEWDEYEKEKHLTFGVLLRGRFESDCFEYRPNKYLALYIKNEYLSPTDYELYGEKIRGIPVRSVYEGIRVASLNTKRGVDKRVVQKRMTRPMQEGGLSLNQAFDVRVFGFHVPYFYVLFSQIYNLIGGLRLAFGKSYDPWT